MTQVEIAAFLAICRHKNITKAAEAMYTTQAALSAHLKALESELGCTLLLRQKGKRSLSLTAQGQAFYQLALQYQDIFHKMGSVGQNTVQESLRISAIISVGDYLLAPVLDRFMDTYPQFSLHLRAGEAETACMHILQGKTDLAFTTAKMETDQIVATPFLKDSFTIICGANSPYPDTVSLEALPLWDEISFRWSSEFAFWQTLKTQPVPRGVGQSDQTVRFPAEQVGICAQERRQLPVRHREAAAMYPGLPHPRPLDLYPAPSGQRGNRRYPLFF